MLLFILSKYWFNRSISLKSIYGLLVAEKQLLFFSRQERM